MTGLNLFCMLLLLIDAPESTPEQLVQKLGAGRFAEREAASEALETLGQNALTVLRQARSRDDLEIRNRAALLIDRIEVSMMVRPTMVQLDFHDQPLMDVVKTLSDRSRIPLALFPNQEQVWKANRVTLERSTPVAFWEALDALCQVSNLQYNGSLSMGSFGSGNSRSSAISLYQSSPGLRAEPKVVTGPFRINMSSIQLHRERNFHLGAPPRVMEPAAGRINRRVPNVPLPSMGTEQFFATLMVMAEPRMTVTMTGPVQLLEVIDDLGQSLIPSPLSPVNGFQHSSGYNRFESGGGTSLQVQAHLKYPERPGQWIRQLRGTLPLALTSRRDDPLTISLADGKGMSFRNAEMMLTLNDVRTESSPAQTQIDLTLRSINPPVAGAAAPEASVIRMPSNPQSQLEIANASGNPIQNWMMVHQNYGPDGLRLTIRVLHREGTDVPTQIRFYDLARATVNADFRFTDVEMP